MRDIDPSPLIGSVQVRPLQRGDAVQLSRAYTRNRQHLAPWEPARTDDFFTPSYQLEVIHNKLAQHSVGQELSWVIVDGGRIIGAVTLTGIVRGPFLNAHLGYWVDGDCNGQGVGSAAAAFAVDHARAELGLHRIQAATLVHNGASRKILQRAGFQEIGVAPQYLSIAGKWQDHLLHQLILN